MSFRLPREFTHTDHHGRSSVFQLSTYYISLTYPLFASSQFEDLVLSACALMEGPVWMVLTPTVNMDLHAYVREDLTALCARNIFLITWKTLLQLHELHMLYD